MIQINYNHIPVSVELRIDGSKSTKCIIFRKSTLLYYTRVYGEFKLAWPRLCGIDVLTSFVLTPGQGCLKNANSTNQVVAVRAEIKTLLFNLCNLLFINFLRSYTISLSIGTENL